MADNSDKVVPQQSPLHHEAAAAATTSTFHSNNFFRVGDVCLRVLLFALSLVAVLVAVTTKQTATVPVLLPNSQTPIFLSASAKFEYTPAIVYMVAALSVSGLYSIITTLLSISALLKRKSDFIAMLLPHIVIFDIILFGIVTAASGAAGAIAYTGLKGNSHVQWAKVCGIFDKFCWRVGSSIILCVVASFVLLLLALISVIDMSKKIRRK